ncbi:MAG: hypothetical protein V1916_03195 [Patescibacteria group bacterium]
MSEYPPPYIPPEDINPQHEVAERHRAQGTEYHPEGHEMTERIFRYWRGDAHTHSAESSRSWGYAEGIYSEREAAEYYGKLGLEFVAFSEHTSNPGKPELLSPDHPISKSFLKQVRRIEQLNAEAGQNVAAMSSCEASVLIGPDGQVTIDLPPEVTSKLDLIIASRHSIANEKDIGAIRESLLATVRNPAVDAIGHPDRYIQLAQGVTDGGQPCDPEKYWQVWAEVLDEMARQGKAFEINFVNRPDDQLLRMAAERGLQFMLNYDAHDFNQYKAGQIEGGDDAKRLWATHEASAGDLQHLEDYKRQRLQSGPGPKAILRLAHYIEKLESLGVTPERVVNSSRERMVDFLINDRGKQTPNLTAVKSKFNV